MEAILTPKLIQSRICGSGPYSNDQPPGFAQINSIAAGNAARGHLLAQSLGGSGIDIRNIVPLFSYTNSVVMTRWEGLLRAALAAQPPSANFKVKYTVRAEYCAPPRVHPRGLWLEAVCIKGNPTTYVNWFKVWLPNEQREKGQILFDFTAALNLPSRLGSIATMTPVPTSDIMASLNQAVQFLSSTTGPLFMPADVYPSQSATTAGSSAANNPSSRQLITSGSNRISCGFTCPLLPSQSPSPQPSESPKESSSAMPSEAPKESPSPQSSSLPGSSRVPRPPRPPNRVPPVPPVPPVPGVAGLAVGLFGTVTGIIVSFFGQECVNDFFPVELLKQSGYTGCRFCSNIEFVHYAVCDSPGGSGEQLVNVMKVLNDEHGLIQCDLAALRRNGADISRCENSSPSSCVVECANCRSSSTRMLSTRMATSYSNISNVLNRQAQGICNRDVCCPTRCGSCGGSGCGSRPGGPSNCCSGSIVDSGVVCGTAPCILSGNSGGSGGGGSTATTGNRDPAAICNQKVCCPASCGACGGSGCGSRPGGAENCCTSHVLRSGNSCDSFAPPCTGSLPAAAPNPAAAPSSVGGQTGNSPATAAPPSTVGGQPGNSPATTAPTATQSIPMFNSVC